MTDKKSDEIAKYQALMSLAVKYAEDLTAEIRYQQGVLKSLGVSDGDILNLIHDRHAREPISAGRARIALSQVRHAAGLPDHRGPLPMRRPWTPTQALDARAAQYMRARGKDARPRSPTGPAPVPQRSGAETRQHPTAPPPGASPTPARRADKTAPTPELLIPYGVSDDGHLVHAREADTAGSYTCPGCTAPLVLHAGAVRARHFSHKANTACDGETLVHITAKLLIAKVINDHRSANSRITLHGACSKCQSSLQRVIPNNTFTSSAVEERVGTFICDVVAFRESAPVLGIEILNSHAVDATKAEQLDIPWIELAAADVLENPLDWRPVQMRLKPMVCPDCKNKRAELERVAERWKLPLSEPLYVPAVAPCWSCKEKILWYWWQGVPFAHGKPPEPVPRTVQFRFSKMYGGKYWMNICPGCRAPQGDNFVFLASDSPFRGLSLTETEEMKAHQQRNRAEQGKRKKSGAKLLRPTEN